MIEMSDVVAAGCLQTHLSTRLVPDSGGSTGLSPGPSAFFNVY